MNMIDDMNSMHLAKIDLNLLVSLQALLEEQSVTRAAKRTGVTQSAMSHALARLRSHFEDPLLIRSANQMLLTPRSEQLVEPLRNALENLARAIDAPKPFDAEAASGVLGIACEDYVTSLLVPNLVHRLSVEAPKMDISIRSRTESTAEHLESGEIDIAIGVFRGSAPNMQQRLLFRENFACVVRRGHPHINKRLTVKRYVELPHILVGDGPKGMGAVDAALARVGETRRVAARVSTFLSAPLIVAETDLILTIPKRLAVRFAKIYDLQLFAPPVRVRDFSYRCRWHERWQNDERHRWLRKLISAESDALLASTDA